MKIRLFLVILLANFTRNSIAVALIAFPALEFPQQLSRRPFHKSQFGGNMKARAIVMTLALGLVGAALCLAADGFLGTWKLNEAKSKLAPGTAKNSTVVYSTMGDNMMVTIYGTDAAGTPTHNDWIGKFARKDYPVTADSHSDSRSVHQL